MVLDSDVVIRITREEAALVVDLDAGRNDTPEEARFRAKVAAEIRDIKARGGVVDIPFDP